MLESKSKLLNMSVLGVLCNIIRAVISIHLHSKVWSVKDVD